MHCLHITNGYTGSALYSSLVQELDYLGIRQTVYHPMRGAINIGVNQVTFNTANSKLLYSPILNLYSRLDYRYKIRTILKDISSKVNFSDIDIIHAHTWFSDGGVAYELYKTHKIPYVISIRSTDVDIFLKFLIHMRGYGLEILKHAKQIIFISPVLFMKSFNSALLRGHQNLREKSQIIPNGIDEFWIKNVKSQKTKASEPLKLIYVGSFIRRKKLDKIIQAVEIVNRSSEKCHLAIVGGGGSLEKKVLSLIDNKKKYFSYHGKIKDKNLLADILNENDVFIMPSKRETFGLVYIEALSQGLPLIYSRNDGIDGLFNEKIGEAINGDNVEEIVEAIFRFINSYNFYKFEPSMIVDAHDWKLIATQLKKIYI